MKRSTYLVWMLMLACITVKTFAPNTSFIACAMVEPQIRVEMYNGVRTSPTNTIYPRFKVINTGTSLIALSELKIRYYYSIDGESPQNFWCDWADVGANNVTGVFVKASDPQKNADYYLEIGFNNGAGVLAPGAATEVQTRFAKEDWSDYIQTNDYSFNGQAMSYTTWDKAAAISGNSVVRGSLPSAFAAPPEASIQILSYSGNATYSNDTLFPRFKVVNTGTVRLDLTQVKIRYYYTMEDNRPQIFKCDWASVKATNTNRIITGDITGRFVKILNPTSDANYYFEMGFTSNAGCIEPKNSAEIHIRIYKDDWSRYRQDNDYSFVVSAANSYVSSDKVPLYIDDNLVAGIAPTKVIGVVLDRPSARLALEETLQLTATVNPLDALNKNVTWKSSDTNVATATPTGLIQGVGPGSAIITVTTEDGRYQAQCQVTVDMPQNNGHLRGIVKDAVNQQNVIGAALLVEKVENNITIPVTKGVSKDDGTYEIALPQGSYQVTVTKGDYITLRNFVIIGSGETVYNPQLRLVANIYSGLGKVQGKITNAIDNSGIPKLTILFRPGVNAKEGDAAATAETDTNGNYTADLDAGNYTGEISGAGFATGYFEVVSIGGKTTPNQDSSVTPILIGDQIRIVLRWGEKPHDLDSHLTGPAFEGGVFHTYFSYKTYGNAASLDLDDMDSFGPETTTILRKNNGVYRYLVHDYSNRASTNSMALADSGAQVVVYEGERLVATYNVPVNQGGTVWSVFEYDGTKITRIDKMYYESDPIKLANPAPTLGEVKLTVTGGETTGKDFKIEMSCTNADHLFLSVIGPDGKEKSFQVIKGETGAAYFTPTAGGDYVFTAAARNTPNDTDPGTERKSRTETRKVIQLVEELPSGWVYVDEAANVIGATTDYDLLNKSIYVHLNAKSCVFYANGKSVHIINGKIAVNKADFDWAVDNYLKPDITYDNDLSQNKDIVRQAQQYLIKIATNKAGWSDCWTDPAMGPNGVFQTATKNSLRNFQDHCQKEWQQVVRDGVPTSLIQYKYLNLSVTSRLDSETFSALEKIADELDLSGSTVKIRVTRLEALNDIDINGVSDNVVWSRPFNNRGELEANPAIDEPVADGITGGSFHIRATIGTYPAAPSTVPSPKIEYSYEIKDSGGNLYSTGSGKASGGICRVAVETPKKVDTYQLVLTLKVYDNANKLMATQVIPKTLYVTLADSCLENGEKPKAAWLERATLWAKGATSEAQAVSLLNSSIYKKSGWIYKGSTETSWKELLEKQNFNGSCYQFTEVWYMLSRILGVQGVEIFLNTGAYENGFLTKPCIALDGQTGNVSVNNGPYDHWYFSNHYYGKWSNRFYDPTFGQIYNSKDDFIQEYVKRNNVTHYILESEAVLVQSVQPSDSDPWGKYNYYSKGN